MKEQILSLLPADLSWQVHWFDTVDSTNNLAKQMAQQGAPHGTVLIADRQTNGRGRMGRSFSSLGGKGIYLSVILRPQCTAQELMHLTCAVAEAMCSAVENAAGIRPGIKWINDLIAGGKKLGGILTELSVDPESGLVNHAVIGIGINCSHTQEDFPCEIRDIAISLDTATGKQTPRERLAAEMILSLQKMDLQLLSHRDAIMAAYRKDCITMGREVTLLGMEEQRIGTAIDIDRDGALLVRFSDGTVKTVCSGEVSVRGLLGYV